jgi:hypothetical protein
MGKVGGRWGEGESKGGRGGGGEEKARYLRQCGFGWSGPLPEGQACPHNVAIVCLRLTHGSTVGQLRRHSE